MKTKLLLIAVVVAMLVGVAAIPAAAEDEIPMWVTSIRIAFTSRNSTSSGLVGTVTVRDANQDPVEGATVFVEWATPDGYVKMASALTSAQGMATFRTTTKESGTYWLMVYAVSKEGWAYDSALNVEDYETFTVP